MLATQKSNKGQLIYHKPIIKIVVAIDGEIASYSQKRVIILAEMKQLHLLACHSIRRHNRVYGF